jgi:pyruvate/2-oxoacid:ferredoxin oxidoreductase beta subunit
MFPLYEIEEGVTRVTYSPEPLRPVTEYLKGQGRYRHLTEESISLIQERIAAEWEQLKYRAIGNK